MLSLAVVPETGSLTNTFCLSFGASDSASLHRFDLCAGLYPLNSGLRLPHVCGWQRCMGRADSVLV